MLLAYATIICNVMEKALSLLNFVASDDPIAYLVVNKFQKIINDAGSFSKAEGRPT